MNGKKLNESCMLVEVEFNAEPSNGLEGLCFLPRLVMLAGLGDLLLYKIQRSNTSIMLKRKKEGSV